MWERNVVEVEELLRVAAPPPQSKVVDIGSGGGVPGVVIAILRPDLSVTLIDSDRRKTGFLTHVAGLLRLPGVTVETLRAEDAGHRDGMRERFDLATSRATAPPPVLCELALPLVRVGGTLCALVADSAAASFTVHRRSLGVRWGCSRSACERSAARVQGRAHT